jgi:hypothetical protein
VEAIRTTEFKIATGDYASLIARRWLAQWWWAFALPLFASIIASTSDTRFVYVSLILIFIIWPMALSFAWFNYMLKPSAIRAVRPCVATFTDQAVTLEYPAPKVDSNDDRPAPAKLSPVTLAWSDIKAIEQEGKLMLLITAIQGNKIADFTAIPTNALSDADWQIILGKIIV